MEPRKKNLHIFKVEVSHWILFSSTLEIYAETEEEAKSLAIEHSEYLHESEWKMTQWKETFIPKNDG